jgi:NADH-ubiquinone oxidoreductase chain 6
MKNLIIIYETFTNGFISNVLDIISILGILSGILVIISKNPIVSVLFLIGLFASISVYLILLGLNFIGLSYLIVYIGAVSILFLFILMLINIRISELQSNTSNSIALSIIIIILFSYCLFPLLPYDIAILASTSKYDSYFNNLLYSANLPSSNQYTDNNISGSSNNEGIFFVTSKSWDGNLAESNHITSIGNIMYTSYNIWLIIASFILLLAMVGAIVITIKPKN